MNNKILIWFRTDLRITDNEALFLAAETGADLLPVYIFDPRNFEQTYFGFERTAAFRARFLLESVQDLRNSLQQMGSNLIVRTGFPEVIVPDLAKDSDANAIYYHKLSACEEFLVEDRLCTEAHKQGIETQGFYGHTLYHPLNLPFDFQHLPDLFTEFRKRVEEITQVRQAFQVPKALHFADKDIDSGDIPTLEVLGVQAQEPDSRAVLPFKGGETAGLARMEEYFWTQDLLREYKKKRNGMLGADYSSKFSPWMALGCLSPRSIYAEVEKYENKRVRNESTYWLIFELLWRDFFHFLNYKYPTSLYSKGGILNLDIEWQEDRSTFALWAEGRTGFPIIDANMRELAATGYMSNRGRQNVASFLTKNLGLDWRLGAEWFESLLIDYDPCSNYGNWNYAASIGSDPRGFRFFNPIKQGKDYDPEGEYVRFWLPKLSELPPQRIHEPWKLTEVEQKRYNIELGKDYPEPVVDLFESAQANEKKYERAMLKAGRRINKPSRIRQFAKKS